MFEAYLLDRMAVGLLPANSTGAYAPIEITESMNFEIWGDGNVNHAKLMRVC